MTPEPIVEVGADAEALAWRAARLIAARASRASERFGLCLSGGSTPKRVHELLGAKDVHAALDWQKVHLFGDGRFVPSSRQQFSHSPRGLD